MTALQEAAWSTAALGADGREDEWQERFSALISKKGRKEERGKWQPLPFTYFLPPSMLHLPHPKPGKGLAQMGAHLVPAGSRAASLPLRAAPMQIVSKTIYRAYHLLR